MENRSGLKSPSEELQRFFSRTTCHGLCQISASSSRIGKLLWICLCLAVVVATVLNIGKLVMFYSTFPVETGVDTRYESELPFPSLTVCNFNQFKRSNLQNNSALSEFSEKLVQDLDFNYSSKITSMMGLKKVLALQNKSLESFFGEKERDDFIVWCELREMNAVRMSCSSRNFIHNPSTMGSSCFTLDIQNKNFKIRDSGFPSGFSVILNVQADEYFINLAEGVGAVVVVHQAGEPAQPEKNGLTLAPGTLNTIMLTGRQIQRLPYPYGGENCTETSQDGLPYSQKECREQCTNEQTVKSCGCEMYSSASNTKLCDFYNDETRECVLSVAGKETAKDGRCQKECPSACSQEFIFPTVSSANWPSKEFMPALRRTLNDSNFSQMYVIKDLQTTRENLLRVDIHYSTMFRDHIIQKDAYPMESLMSDIGGQLGLFIGISVLTLVEFAELVFILLQICFIKKKVVAKTEGGNGYEVEEPNHLQTSAQ